MEPFVVVNERPVEDSVDLKHYVRLIRLQKWIVILAVVVAGALALLVSRLMTPIYAANAMVVAESSASPDASNILVALRAGESLAQTYSAMLTSRTVLDQVMQEFDLYGNRDDQYKTWDDFQERVITEPLQGTQLIQLTVEDISSQRAADLANRIVAVMIEVNQSAQAEKYASLKDNLLNQITTLNSRIEQTTQSLDTLRSDAEANQADISRLEGILAQYTQNYTSLLASFEQVRLAEVATSSNIRQVDTAVPVKKPARPKTAVNIVVAGLLGLMGSVSVIFLRDILDDTLRNPEMIDALARKLKLTVVGQIGRFDAENTPIITAAKPRAAVSETFRTIRANIKFASVDKPVRSILVTSAAPSEGKSIVSANLSVGLAQSGFRTVLIDADLRRPKVHDRLGLSNRAGFTDLFVADDLSVVDTVVQPTGTPLLDALVSGPLPPNPAELLDTEKARQIVAYLTEKYERVVIDSPPMIALADAYSLTQYVDGVLVVGRVGQTRVKELEKAVVSLRRAGAHLLGLVLVDPNGYMARYSGYYYYYDRRYNEYFDEEGDAPERRRLLKRRDSAPKVQPGAES